MTSFENRWKKCVVYRLDIISGITRGPINGVKNQLLAEGYL